MDGTPTSQLAPVRRCFPLGAMESENDATRRRLFWEKAGKPLFGRLWTYHEIKYKQNAPKSRGSKALPHANLDTPTEWPTDTRIDPGPWVSWLPVEEGWQQGKRTQIESGKVLTCYFSPPPEFKRFWHKSAIEKYLGRTLEAAARVAQPKSETGQAERYVARCGHLYDVLRYIYIYFLFWLKVCKLDCI